MFDRSAVPSVASSSNRITELESVRGIAALLVVIYHMPGWNPFFYDHNIIKNSYLMVELFFVLSGFVICKAYSEKIQTKKGLLHFQFLRFGRLYPVHIIFLIIFLLIEFSKHLAASKLEMNIPNSAPFVENSWAAFLQHIFLVQAIVPSGDSLTFNGPAWSISVEFYTYLLFGLIVLCFNRFKTFIFALLGVLASVLLIMQASSDYTNVLRCLAGFFIGCCTASVSDRLTVRFQPYVVTLVFIAILCFLQFKPSKSYDVAICFLTSLLILTMVSSESGYLKRFLQLKSLVWLGTISYSVYMSHTLFLWIFNQVYRVIFHKPEMLVDNTSTPQLTTIEALVSYVLVIACVLFFGHLIHEKVEKPFREKSRKLIFKPALKQE